MNNPGGYCLIDFKNPTTDGKTIRGIYQKIGAAYNSGKILIISNFAPTPLALWVTKVETEEVEIEGENVTFDKYTIGVYNTKENDKNYENVVTVRYNDEVKLSKTEITGGTEWPDMEFANRGDVLTLEMGESALEPAWVPIPNGVPSVPDDTPVGTPLVSTRLGDYEWSHPNVSEVRVLNDRGNEHTLPLIYIGDVFNEDYSSAECAFLLELEDRYASGPNGKCEYNGVLPQITVAEGESTSQFRTVRAVQLLTYEILTIASIAIHKATFLYFNGSVNKYMLVEASAYMNGSRPTSEIRILHTFN